MQTRSILGTFISTLLLLLLFLTQPAVAAPCDAAEYHQFDFWQGEWVVHSLDGQPQGENTITVEENGCLLVERWRDSQGGTGQSYNYYNAVKDQWHQLWVSPGAIIDYTGGLDKSGAMYLEGHIYGQTNGKSNRFMGRWTPRADGSVLQELKAWDPDADDWAKGFTGVYTRKP